MEGILDQAEIVKIKDGIGGPAPAGMQNVIDESVLESISFAEPETVMYMAEYFSLNNEDIIDLKTSDKLRLIYEMSKESGEPFIEFLHEAGLKVGGRFSDGFLDRVYAYLTLLRQESSAVNRADLLRRERELYENRSIIQ